MKFLTKFAVFVAIAFALNLLLIQATVLVWRALFSKNFVWPDWFGHAERFVRTVSTPQAEPEVSR